MEYVDIKSFEMVKGTGAAFGKNFYDHTIVREFPGLAAFEVGMNSSNPDYDLVVVTITWVDKEAYLNFKKSDVHAASHKQRTPNPNMIRHHSMNFEKVHTLIVD